SFWRFFLRLGDGPGRRQHFHRPTGLFDGGDRRFRGAVNFERDLGLDFAATEQSDTIAGASERAGFHQDFSIDDAAGIELAGIDRALNAVKIDLNQIEREDVVEAALWQAPVQRHLAAFKALDPHTRARGLALAATTGLLALARADAAPDPHPLLARARI